ncbi:hypothetical protein Tco_0409218 [Tanacetum coccineum]
MCSSQSKLLNEALIPLVRITELPVFASNSRTAVRTPCYIKRTLGKLNTIWFLAEYIHAAGVFYAANTSIHAAGLVCAGSIMFLLADLFYAGVSRLFLLCSADIVNADHNLWRIVQQGNSPKRLGKDAKGIQLFISVSLMYEHVAVQREIKVRNLVCFRLYLRFNMQLGFSSPMLSLKGYSGWLLRLVWWNEESKKMRKTMLKQQFTEFSVTEEEGLHKGYDRFQKILSQLNQVQAMPEMMDITLEISSSTSSSLVQVALALKTRGGLESMSFDDLYNKLRSLELDVRIGHSYGVKVAAAPTHSAFIGAASSGSKLNYSNQQSIVPPVSQTSGRSDSIMECVLHSFVAENEPDQDMIYEDFDQVDQLEMEELDLKWQICSLMLSLRLFFPEPVEEDNPLYSWFVKAGENACMTSLQTQRPMHPVIQASRPRPKTSHLLFDIKTLPSSDVEDQIHAGSLILSLVYLKQQSVPCWLVGIRQLASVTVVDLDPADSRNRPQAQSESGLALKVCQDGNRKKLDDFVQVKGGIVKFGGGDGRISGKGTIRTSKLDFECLNMFEERYGIHVKISDYRREAASNSGSVISSLTVLQVAAARIWLFVIKNNSRNTKSVKLKFESKRVSADRDSVAMFCLVVFSALVVLTAGSDTAGSFRCLHFSWSKSWASSEKPYTDFPVPSEINKGPIIQTKLHCLSRLLPFSVLNQLSIAKALDDP